MLRFATSKLAEFAVLLNRPLPPLLLVLHRTSAGKSCIISIYMMMIQLHGTRHGAGIYSYLDPALADGFATSCTSSPYRVMIACDVIVSSGGKRRRAADSVSNRFFACLANLDLCPR